VRITDIFVYKPTEIYSKSEVSAKG